MGKPKLTGVETTKVVSHINYSFQTEDGSKWANVTAHTKASYAGRALTEFDFTNGLTGKTFFFNVEKFLTKKEIVEMVGKEFQTL